MKEWLWVLSEILDLKYRLWRGELVLLQVVIETSAWAPEVRYPSGWVDVGPYDAYNA